MASNPFLIFLFIHLVALVLGFGSVMVVDVFGLLWLSGKVKLALVNRVAHVTQRLIWLGWGGLVLSGIGLIYLKGSVDNLTLIKLFLVAALGVNGIFLHYIKKSMEHIRDGRPDRLEMFRIGLATVISQIGWWGAVVIGFLHRHWRHSIPWPENPWFVISVLTAVFLGAAFTGELLLRHHHRRRRA